MRIRPFDILATLIMLLFPLISWLFAYDRFIRFRGRANVAEFYVYAALILFVLCIFWGVFRRCDWDPRLLFLVAGGMILHCVGCIPVDEGKRIYDLFFLGIRFDKYVHFFTAFVGYRVVLELFKFEGVFLGRLRIPAIVLIVLGVGSCWELIEFVVVRTVPHNGVGLYDNNMLDLFANLVGALSSLVVDIFLKRGRNPSLDLMEETR